MSVHSGPGIRTSVFAPSRRVQLVVAVTAVAALAIAPLLGTQPAHAAADPATVTVVGTSDVYDSNLVQSVIAPGFHQAYPQYTLKYVSLGTGAAITYAEAGTADALIVHAASLENQFVASGYSTEQYGRAIFYGDYVLLGPKSDPAHVLTGAPHDIATAFEDIAAAGVNGNANFVSRGGTPGTTVQEHAIWALTSPDKVSTCTVSTANGGGTSPSTTTGACASPIAYPTWYHATGLTQAPNIENADTCSYSGGNCYTLTDRGTYQYLLSTGAISNLGIVARDNAASARGGVTALVNSFHAYAVNPNAVPNGTTNLNTAGAAAFLSWITSTSGQKQIGAYLDSSGDAPFLPSAAPVFSSSTPTVVSYGKPLTVSGTLANVVPGTPALSGKTVTISSLSTDTPTGTPKTLGTATTDTSGRFIFTTTPSSGAVYYASTPASSQIENATLNPVFGDLLAATSLQPFGTTAVANAPAWISNLSVSKTNTATVTVAFHEKTPAKSQLIVQGYYDGGSTSWKALKTAGLRTGVIAAATQVSLGSAKHTWHLRIVYGRPGQTGFFSGPKTVVVK